MWPFQPELNNEVFDDDIDGQEGASRGLTSKVSPRPSLSADRQEYVSLAAVPRLSRLSQDLQVSVPPLSELEQPFSAVVFLA